VASIVTTAITATTVPATSAGAVRIRILERGDAAPWRTYLERHERCLFHREQWAAPFATYRLAYTKLVALRDGEPVGILPLVRQRSWLFGDWFVSLPWFDAAGPLADDEPTRSALTSAAVAYARKQGADGVELRHLVPDESLPPARSDKVLLRLQLECDGDTLWKRLAAKVRNQVRKGEKANLQTETGGPELVRDFHRVYSTNMGDLGSPAHSRRFFDAVMKSFGEDAQIHVTRLSGNVIGAGLTLRNGDCLEIPWASSLRRYNSLCVNHAMYWHMLRRACDDGFRWFHFGRSTVDSGTYHFKRQWGAEPVPLYWYRIPTAAHSPAKPPGTHDSFVRATAIWQRMPLWVTRAVGPHVIRRVS